jgi:hypothetical protein
MVPTRVAFYARLLTMSGRANPVPDQAHMTAVLNLNANISHGFSLATVFEIYEVDDHGISGSE